MKSECNYDKKKDELTVKLFKSFEETPPEVLTPYQEELDKKPDVHKALVRMGYSEQLPKLRQYMICLYGGDDNQPDICSDCSTYSHCGQRGICPVEGTEGLCSLPVLEGRKLSPVEVEVSQFLADEMSVKMIAGIRKRSVHTVTRQVRNLRRKAKSFTVVGLVGKLLKSGIVKTT